MTGPAGRAAGTAAGRPAGTVAGTPAGIPARTAGSTPADTPDSPVPAPADGQDAPKPRGRRLRLWLVGLVGLVLAGLLVLALLQFRPSSEREVRQSALQAATVYTTSLTTFDARTLDEDVERVRRASTEEFQAQYDETIAGIRETVLTEQRVSSGTVVGAGLEKLDDDTATVLVAVNQELSAAAGEPRTEANRIRMVLERADGRWLIKSVERL